jgi:hypothetical protein
LASRGISRGPRRCHDSAVYLALSVQAPWRAADELRGRPARLATSHYCRDHDLVGPITMLIAGRVVRVAGKGLVREKQTKSGAA